MSASGSGAKTEHGRFFEDFRLGETLAHATPRTLSAGDPAVYAGDTLSASSRVIGLKENSNRKTGVVTVRTTGRNQRGEMVLDYIRWVMVNKRDPASLAPAPVTPDLPAAGAVADLAIPARLAP